MESAILHCCRCTYKRARLLEHHVLSWRHSVGFVQGNLSAAFWHITSSPLCQISLSIVQPEAGLQSHMNSVSVWLVGRYLLCCLATWYNEGGLHLPNVVRIQAVFLLCFALLLCIAMVTMSWVPWRSISSSPSPRSTAFYFFPTRREYGLMMLPTFCHFSCDRWKLIG